MKYPEDIINKLRIALETDDLEEGEKLEDEVLSLCLNYELETNGIPNIGRVLDLIEQVIES